MGAHPHFLWTDFFSGKRKSNDLEKVLKENVLFSKLTRRELKYLSNFVYERVFHPNEPVFRQSERGVGMYLISSGKVAITTQGAGSEIFVTELGAGSFLGELALVDPQHLRSANAVAQERSVLIGFFKPDLEDILERNPRLGVKILFQLATVLGRRLIETTNSITQLRTERSPEKSSQEKSSHDAKAA